MYSLEEQLQVNKWLLDRYGRWEGADVPRYRVSWSTNQTEKRLVKDRAVYSGPIFLRHETGVFELPKYPYDQDRWVLEKCIPNPAGYDIVDCNYSYEPLWVFKTNKGNYLPLERKAINLILKFHEDPSLTRMTPGMVEDEELKKEANEVAEFEMILEEMMTPWSQMDLVE